MTSNRVLTNRRTLGDKNIKHCCEAMKSAVENRYCPVVYITRLREYNILDRHGIVATNIARCFECGKKLPKSLRDEWFDTLEKEYGLEWPDQEYRIKAPKKFHTDKWWKKRGL